MSKLICEITKSARKQKKMTLQALALISGVSVGHLSEFENGKTELGGEKLISICRVLGVNLITESTVGEEDYPYTKSLPLEEQNLLAMFRRLDDRHKENIVEIVAGYEALKGK